MHQNVIRFLFFLISFVSQAQYSIKHYTSKDGLAHDLCYAMMQDRQGRIWLGTDDGLMRYNGNQFQTYGYSEGFESNYVIDVFQTQNAKIYAATWGAGLHEFKKGKFVPLGDKKKVSKVAVLGGKFICKSIGNDFYILDAKKTISGAFVVDRNLYKLREKALLEEAVNFEFEKAWDGVYFFSAFEKSTSGIFKFNTTGYTLRPVFPFLKNLTIKYFGSTADGNFYASTHTHLFLFNHQKLLRVVQLPFGNVKVKRVMVKKDKALFQLFDSGKATDFVALLDLKSGEFKTWQPEVFENKLISDILIDKDQNYWVSTYGAGLFKIFEENFGVNNFYFPNENVSDINEDAYNLFFIAGNKIHALNKHTQKTSTYTFPNVVWKSYRNRQGDLNFLTKDVHSLTKVTINGKSYEVGGTYDFSEFAYRNWRFQYKGTHLTILNQTKAKTYRLIKEVVDIVPFGDYVYIALDKGLLVFDIRKETFIKYLLKQNGLANDKIIDLVLQKDKLWIATANGLVYLKNNRIYASPEADILPSKSIFSMCLDKHGVLWIATQKGLALCKENTFYTFRFSNPSISSYLFKIYCDAKGQIWGTGNKGVFMMPNERPFQPVKTSSLYLYKNNKKLTHEVISYSENAQWVQVRWNDETWKPVTGNEIDFSKLQFGNYTVQFRNRLGDSNWEYSSKIQMVNKAPWYKEWWGLTLIVFLTALLLAIIGLIRFKKIQQRNEFLRNTISAKETLEKELKEVRENVAQDFHDELGNKLAGITVLSALMKEDVSNKDSKKFQQISRIHKDSEELYYGIKDFIWSIDSKNDDLNELVFYLKDFGDELFMYTDTAFSVINLVDNTQFKLPYYWSRQILLLFKEAMTNTMKYAKAQKCQLSFEIIDNQLRVAFDDDGIGFKENELKRINGLKNMQKRAQKLNAVLEIHSEKGTLIKLICPKFL
ncbi:ligand-binding sensor domain-containing protein [Flavobacterium sp.]|uniref:ligand-binding sensor domain-containing protein n=1 Tax=Flavobacterium sp. TaxID=239 RepID=UPI003D0C7445